MSDQVTIQEILEVAEIEEVHDSGINVVHEVVGELGVVEHLIEGPPGPPGIQGPVGSDLTFRYEQSAPASVWEIQHDLGKSPSIRVLDSSGNDVVGDYADVDENKVILYFSAPFSGVAVLN